MKNRVVELLRIIGSPLLKNISKHQITESRELFNIAQTNRIGLFYLQVLKDNRKLNKLEEEYEKLNFRYTETLVTTANLSQVLNDNNIPYSTIKTIRPFPATPNDIDVIYLGKKQDFKSANNILKKNGYREFEKAPGQVLYFDERGGNEFNQNKYGGIYYIDFYRELMVKRFIYLDRRNLAEYIIKKEIVGERITNVLAPPIDLALILFHACFPNRKYSLEIFYTTLFFLKRMKEDDIKTFKDFIYNNSIKYAINSSLSITNEIYGYAFGELSPNLTRLINQKEIKRYSIRRTVTDEAGLPPYQIKFWLFLFIFLNRLVDFVSFRSFIIQMLCFFNPKYLIRFLLQLICAKEIDKRYQQV